MRRTRLPASRSTPVRRRSSGSRKTSGRRSGPRSSATSAASAGSSASTSPGTTSGLLTAAVWGPNVVSLFVGSWVDQRRRKRLLLIVADLARALVLLTVPLAYLLDTLTLEQLYAVALLTGFGQVLFSTAYPPFFVALVRRDQFLDANSKLSASRCRVVRRRSGGRRRARPARNGAGRDRRRRGDVPRLGSPDRSSARRRAGRRGAEGQSLVRRAREGLSLVLRQPILRPCLADRRRSTSSR